MAAGNCSLKQKEQKETGCFPNNSCVSGFLLAGVVYVGICSAGSPVVLFHYFF